MRTNRRRTRRTDSLASREAIRYVLAELRASLPDIIPSSDKSLVKMLQAVRNIRIRPATDTKRGRPSRYERADLLKTDSQLAMILSRETSISVRSFIGQYLPILTFPDDVVDALEHGQINLFEAHQLARITPHRIGSPNEARLRRRKLLEAHLLSNESGERLRARVKETLGEVIEQSATGAELVAVEKVDALLEMDPLDSTHLFYEELRRIGRAIREIQPEELTDKVLEELMPALDQLSAILHGIETRRQKREQLIQRIKIQRSPLTIKRGV